MPSIKCRTCKKLSQAAFIGTVEKENEKSVVHIRYCAAIALLLLSHLIF